LFQEKEKVRMIFSLFKKFECALATRWQDTQLINFRPRVRIPPRGKERMLREKLFVKAYPCFLFEKKFKCRFENKIILLEKLI